MEMVSKIVGLEKDRQELKREQFDSHVSFDFSRNIVDI